MTPEGAVVKACLDYLELRGIFAWRNNTTGIYDQKAKRFRPNHGLNGVSDILGVLPDGRFLAVECKSETGKVSPAQWAFLNRVEQCGGVAIVARSVADLVAITGLMVHGGKGRLLPDTPRAGPNPASPIGGGR